MRPRPNLDNHLTLLTVETPHTQRGTLSHPRPTGCLQIGHLRPERGGRAQNRDLTQILKVFFDHQTARIGTAVVPTHGQLSLIRSQRPGEGHLLAVHS